MFALLDERTHCSDVTDLTLSFLPIRWLDFAGSDRTRVYRSSRGFGGLLEPTLVFRESVWHDRLTHEDTSVGVKLTAHRRLRASPPRGEADNGRPVPTRSSLLVQVFSLVKLPSHALCNSGLTRILQNKGEEASDNEIEYLLSHFSSFWLPHLYSYFQDAPSPTVAHTGLGEVLGEILCGTTFMPRLDVIFVDTVKWICSTLESDSERRFRKLVLEPFRSSFERIFIKLEAKEWPVSPNTQEALTLLRRSFREHLFNRSF